ARSARPSSKAVSSSLTNKPLPPTLDSVRSSIWSPRVVISSRFTSHCGYSSRKRARTCSACHRARRLARVAITSLEGACTCLTCIVIDDQISGYADKRKDEQPLEQRHARISIFFVAGRRFKQTHV